MAFTFEQISETFQKNPYLGLPYPGLITQVYHWWGPSTETHNEPPTIKNLKQHIFFFSDNPFDWADTHLYKYTRLFKIDVLLKNPFFVLDQFYDFESIFVNPSPEYSLVLEGNFDSILYTPHKYGRGVRQGMVINAKKSIISVEETDKPPLELVEIKKRNQAKLWGEILLNSKD